MDGSREEIVFGFKRFLSEPKEAYKSAKEHFFFFWGRKVGVPPPKAVSAAKVNNHHLKTFYCHVDTVIASLSENDHNL